VSLSGTSRTSTVSSLASDSLHMESAPRVFATSWTQSRCSRASRKASLSPPGADGRDRRTHPATSKVPRRPDPESLGLPVAVRPHDQLRCTTAAHVDDDQRAQLVLLEAQVAAVAVCPAMGDIPIREVTLGHRPVLVRPRLREPGGRPDRQPGPLSETDPAVVHPRRWNLDRTGDGQDRARTRVAITPHEAVTVFVTPVDELGDRRDDLGSRGAASPVGAPSRQISSSTDGPSIRRRHRSLRAPSAFLRRR
jgi:hypothetical protein